MKIVLKNISKAYGNSIALDTCTMVIDEGTFHAIIGPNGSGKSTILRIASLLEAPDSGEVIYVNAAGILEKDIALRRKIAVVLPGDSLFHDTVFNNVAYGLHIRKMNREIISNKVHNILGKFRLSDKHKKSVLTLSSGQRQRVALARALVIEPQFLFLDEPTVSLDPSNAKRIEEVLRESKKNNQMTIVMITHNVFQAKRLADRVTFMYRGRVIESEDCVKFFNNPENELTLRFISGKMVW